MSRADEIFVRDCRRILDEGYEQKTGETRAHWADDGSPAYTKKICSVVNRYNLQEEFPIQTIRPINYKAAIDEILWIWQKKSNVVAELNSKIWNQWEQADGTIGKAYGYQLGRVHKYPEGEFDQVDRVLYQLKNDPNSRRILTSMYNFDDLNEMALYPCAYGMMFNVFGNKLNGILQQRSQDMLVANGWNVVQYATLLHMFAQVSGLEAGELVHVISDAHIYDRHFEIVEEVIQREQYPAPKLWINPEVKDFYDFTVDDFVLEDYKHGERVRRIPVAE